MGRWVTSKGRRIYIPDEGEKNPFAKEDSGAKTNSDKMIDMMKESYIKVMGKEKWDGLSDQQKHDTIMGIAKGATAWREAAENKTVSDNEAKKEKELAANKAQAEDEKYRKQYDSEWSKYYREAYLTKDSDEKLGELQKEMMKVIDREHKNPGSVNRQQLHMSFGVLNAINQERQQRKGGWKASATPKDKRKKK